MTWKSRTCFGLIALFVSAAWLFAGDLYTLRSASGALTAGETTAAVSLLGRASYVSGAVYLDITTLTLPDADDEVDFYIQTTYDDGTSWTDIENIHFTTADNGSTAQRVVVIDGAEDGPGSNLSITGTDPATGAEISETVPANTIWMIKVIRFTLVTESTSANRGVLISLGDGTNTYHQTRQHDVQIASETRTYDYVVGGNYIAAHLFTVHHNILPDLTMSAGHVWQTVTGSIQAGDNYGAPQSSLEAWHDPSISTDAAIGDDLKSYDRPLGSQVRIRTVVTGATAPTYAYSATFWAETN